MLVRYRFDLSSNVEKDSVFLSGVPVSRWVGAATYTVFLGFRRGRYNYIFASRRRSWVLKRFYKWERITNF